MALSDLAIFSEFVYESKQEELSYNIDLFNAAAGGTIVLATADHIGDYSDAAIWARIDGLVRRRNAYGTGNVSEKNIDQLLETMVRVAAGTPPVRIDPVLFRWIGKDPAMAGAMLGQQLAQDELADMLNVAINCVTAALAGVSDVFHDASSGELTVADFNLAAAKFGDRAQAIRAWIMHSKVQHDIYAEALGNGEGLFTYGTVRVQGDNLGRPFIVSDAPTLIEAGTPNTYYTLGLTTAAVRIDQNPDFDDNYDTLNGKENIVRTYQAEWSYNVGVKGFSWDKTNGGPSPTDSALGTATNWDKYVTSIKDLAGVLIESQ